MKVIVAGSRTITHPAETCAAIILSGFEITELVCGMCPEGPDEIARQWAERCDVPIKPFPADWANHHRGAGPIRNSEMAAYADALIAVWDGVSAGTKDMINKANARNLRVYVREVRLGQGEKR